jgi:hypothetical protein
LQRTGNYFITQSSLDGAVKLGLAETSQIIEAVLKLSDKDFYKTMPARKKPELFQDVYKTIVNDFKAYIKLQINLSSKAVVISFKPDTS